MPGGLSDSSQWVGGDGQRIDDEDDDPARVVERRWHAGFVQRLEDLQRIEHAAHAHIVRYAAVDEVEIGSMDAVAKGFFRPGASVSPARPAAAGCRYRGTA